MITSVAKGLSGLALLAGGATLLLGAGGHASANASSSGSTTANVSVNSTITLSALPAGFTLTGNPSSTVSTVGAVTMNVLTNSRTGYNVTVQASSATLAGATAPANTDTIPIANLKARETGQPTYTSVSNATALTVHSQATKSAPAGDTLSNDFQVVIPFVNSDTYSTTLNYVATTQ